MDELGYDVEWQLLNSKYFGVPQSRERVFIIGHSRERPSEAVFPIAGGGGQTDLVQGDGGIVTNTLTTKTASAISNGCYPMSNGGVLRVNDFHKKESE